MIRLPWFVAAPIAAAFALGCGGAPKPVTQLAASEGAIRGAQEAGAANNPDARLYLTMAEEEHQKGLSYVDDDHDTKASSMFIRAKADAELALAIARAQHAKHEAAQATASVEAVKQEND